MHKKCFDKLQKILLPPPSVKTEQMFPLRENGNLAMIKMIRQPKVHQYTQTLHQQPRNRTLFIMKFNLNSTASSVNEAQKLTSLAIRCNHVQYFPSWHRDVPAMELPIHLLQENVGYLRHIYYITHCNGPAAKAKLCAM